MNVTSPIEELISKELASSPLILYVIVCSSVAISVIADVWFSFTSSPLKLTT